MNDRAEFEAGIAALGLTVPAMAAGQLLAFEALLLKWNRTYNLTAVRDLAGVRVQHLLDSLSIVPWVDQLDGRQVLDVGSGGGLPGIPLAIVRPDLSITLVDAVQKKVSFLQQACIELGLKNVMARHVRVETLPATTAFDVITSRAFAEIRLFVELTRGLLKPGGRWLAMKGQLPESELKDLPTGVVVEHIHRLVVPGLDAERHLIVLKVVD